MTLIPAFEIGVWNAWIFMIWLILQTIAARLFSEELYNKAGDHSEKKSNHTDRVVGSVSQLIWLLGTVYSVFLPFQLGTIWFYIGLSIFFIGLITLMVASVNFAVTPMDEPITQGIYRYSRHPMYIAIFLIYLSVGIASTSWVFLLISIVWLFLLTPATASEEHYCLGKYGDTYSDYMKRTPRFIGIPKS